MEPIDPQVKNLVSAIGRAETGTPNPKAYIQKGASGEFGRYQFVPGTYKSYAKKYLGNENAEPNVENQNKIAYSFVKEKKDAGYNPAQIASMWNAGEGRPNAYKENHKGVNSKGVQYDTPAYVAKVSKYYDELKSGTHTAEAKESIPAQKKEITGLESPLEAGANAIKNTVVSAFDFGKGVINSVNPIHIADTIGQIVSPNENPDAPKVGIGDVVKEIPKALYEGLIPKALRQTISGDLQGASKSIQEDPFGTVAPLVFAAEGGAKLADNAASKSAMKNYVENIGENTANKVPIPKPTTKYSDAFDAGVKKTAGTITKPIGAVVGKIGDLGGGITKSLASQFTGLDPQTMQQILSNPKEFSKIAQDNTSRGGLAGEVNSAISKRIESLSETGKGYEPIKAQTNLVPDTTGFIEDIFEKNGFRIEKGKIKADSMSSTRNTADINALQKFYDNWGKRVGLTPAEFLNMRTDLADLAKYDKLTGTGKTAKAQVIADQLRQESNRIFRPKIEGLDKLDRTYSEEKTFLNKVKKDYLNRDGTFKDGAVNKIANATGVGKENLLNRLEQIVPGITKRIQILKAVEDIERANGIKVGTYTRGAIQAGGILTGNIPAIVTAILTSPSSAVRILRAAGYTGAKLQPILSALRMLGGDLNNLPKGTNLTPGLLMREQEKTY